MPRWTPQAGITSRWGGRRSNSPRFQLLQPLRATRCRPAEAVASRKKSLRVCPLSLLGGYFFGKARSSRGGAVFGSPSRFLAARTILEISPKGTWCQARPNLFIAAGQRGSSHLIRARVCFPYAPTTLEAQPTFHPVNSPRNPNFGHLLTRIFNGSNALSF